MDKQMIEEMASIICKETSNKGLCKKCDFKKHRQFDFIYQCSKFDNAEALYNAGYRKIPEGAVVLTGTETEERLEDLLIEFDEMSFYPATLMPNAEECAREWKSKLIYAIGQLRKETAEKFAERLKDKYDAIGKELQKSYDDVFGSDLPEWSVPDVVYSYGYIDKIDEICKELTGGK